MPRSSAGSSSKRQGLHANGHNSNNNSSLSLPKRSNRSRASSSASSFTLASTNQPATSDISNAAAASAAAAAQCYSTPNGTANMDVANGWQGKGQRYYDCIAGDDGDSFGEGLGDHQKIDLNPSGGRASEMSPATVLSSFPLLDTIMLLIIFLQIPPAISTLIHFLFFVATFVSPSTTLFSISTTVSMPSFTNLLLQGSNGSPSLLTIMFADCILASVSLFLWPSAWNFLVDFAQAIIAIAMGAGSSTGDSLRNVAVCAGVMGGLKAAQGRLDLWDAWDSIRPTRQQRTSQMLSGRIENAGWLRTFFAIHIVAQAAMKATRRWLIRRPETADLASATTGPTPGTAKDGASAAKLKDKDPEAAVGAASAPMLERTNSVGCGKRKKKTQVQSIRNNQPMWATVASAAIHIAKEFERIQLSSEASNTNAGGAGVPSNESAAGGDESGRVWITKIGSTDVGFVAELARGKEGGYGYDGNAGGIDAVGMDRNSPFFVRVNGIVWPQTTIRLAGRRASTTGESPAGDAGGEDEWTVEVTGLTGSTEYDFEFVKKGAMVFYSTSACTLPAQAASTIPSVVKHTPPSRPLSPVTTLLHSLAQANSLLAENKANLKSIRKSQKTGLSEIRKEIEKHRGLIGNDRGEERAFRRNLALRESIKRAEEEMEQMSKQLSALQTLPEQMKPEWESKKKQWQAEKRRLAAAQAKAAEEKASADRQATAVESEVVSLATKKEKLQTRLSKLRIDLGRLDNANSEGSDAREKKQAERDAAEARRKETEKKYLDVIADLEARRLEYVLGARENWEVYRALQQQQQQQQQQHMQQQQMQMQRQMQQEMALPGSAHGSMQFGMQPLQQQQQGADQNRERSLSLFSDGSVITNLSDLGHMGFETAVPSRHGSLEYSTPVAVMGGRRE